MFLRDYKDSSRNNSEVRALQARQAEMKAEYDREMQALKQESMNLMAASKEQIDNLASQL
jgi:hypothetical protein